MNKKIISGISLAVVLVMFATLLTGCHHYEYIYTKIGDKQDNMHEIQFAKYSVYQDESSDEWYDKYKIKINIKLKDEYSVNSYVMYKGDLDGLTRNQLQKGVKISVKSTKKGRNGKYDSEYVKITFPVLYLNTNGKAKHSSAYIEARGEEYYCYKDSQEKI